MISKVPVFNVLENLGFSNLRFDAIGPSQQGNRVGDFHGMPRLVQAIDDLQQTSGISGGHDRSSGVLYVIDFAVL